MFAIVHITLIFAAESTVRNSQVALEVILESQVDG